MQHFSQIPDGSRMELRGSLGRDLQRLPDLMQRLAPEVMERDDVPLSRRKAMESGPDVFAFVDRGGYRRRIGVPICYGAVIAGMSSANDVVAELIN